MPTHAARARILDDLTLQRTVVNSASSKEGTDPAFSAAAFAMTRKGEISAPVLSKFGYHHPARDRRSARVRSFEEVKPDLMAEQKKQALADARRGYAQIFLTRRSVNTELIDRLQAEAAIGQLERWRS